MRATTARAVLFTLLAFVGLPLLLVGVATPAGRGILAPLGDTASAAGRVLRDNTPDLTSLGQFAAGPAGAVLAGLALFAGAVLLVPWCRSGRGLAVTAVASAVLALYLGGGFS